MPKTPEREVKFRIVLRTPPPGIDFGLQMGLTATASIEQKQRSGGGDLRFSFTLALVSGGKTGATDFRGPAAQGRPGERFVYISIGTAAGQPDSPCTRRLKVPLTGITPEIADRAAADAAMVLEASVPGTGRDGGPNCATVKPFDGWKASG